ncbi:RNA binding protein 34 [Trichuris trichiura]|uniref:RNA binding protein 34 n=1 Tax=Trichuris trichiura TaxID=36087 RepID=A0A077ZCH2_TRITR|nr:RNA binding protein 34 [Trichuris trichiura]
MNKRSANSKLKEELDRRTVFVSNLPADVTKRELLKLVKQFGPVETVRLRSCIPKDPAVPKKVAVIKGELVGRINAYVRFKEESSVEKALSLNGSEVRDHHVFVDSCLSKRIYEKKRSVFVGNLPFDVSEDQLYEHFADCGEIKAVRVVRDKKYGLGKGFGYVVFQNASSVLLALKLHGSQMGRREIRIFKIEGTADERASSSRNRAKSIAKPSVGKRGKISRKGKGRFRATGKRKKKSIMK